MPKRSAEHMAEQRQRILAAALRCYRERGFHRTGIKDICKAAGLSVGAVYTHFKNKRAIVLALADQSLEGFHNVHLNTLQEVKQFLTSGIDAFRNPERAEGARVDFQVMQLSLHHKKLQDRAGAVLQAPEQLLRQALQALQDRGEIAPDYDVKVGAATLTSIMTAAWLTKVLMPAAKLNTYRDCIVTEFARMAT